MQYPIYKQSKRSKILILWDGPSLSREEAKKLLKIREKDYPDDKFFIVKVEE